MRYKVIKFGVTIGEFKSLVKAKRFFNDNKLPYTSIKLYDSYTNKILEYWSY